MKLEQTLIFASFQSTRAVISMSCLSHSTLNWKEITLSLAKSFTGADERSQTVKYRKE
jgi:hypothetical protein